MTWTKVDRRIADDPDLIELDRGDRLLHIEGLTWCNDHGTNGKITRRSLPRLGDHHDPEAGAAALVRVGKWIETDDGWEIPDFLDDQPAAEDVEKTKALARVRARRQRQHRGGDHSLCDPKYCVASRDTSRVTHTGSHDTRTDPVRTGGTRTGPGPAGAARPTRLPFDPHAHTDECCNLPAHHRVHEAS